MVAISADSSPQAVAISAGGTTSFGNGTNPLSIGMPGGNDGPFILDFGTSATAEGKVRVKRIAGESVPLGWILDADVVGRRFVEHRVAREVVGAMEEFVNQHARQLDAVHLEQIREERVVEKSKARERYRRPHHRDGQL